MVVAAVSAAGGAAGVLTGVPFTCVEVAAVTFCRTRPRAKVVAPVEVFCGEVAVVSVVEASV